MNSLAGLPSPSAQNVRPVDRLGFTLFIACLLHLALIFGLGFTLPQPTSASKALEITLSTFKSQEKPKQADFLAQDNQQGSGTLENKAVPSTTDKAAFQDNRVQKVTAPASPRQEQQAHQNKSPVTSLAPQKSKALHSPENNTPAPPAMPVHAFDRTQLSAEIASLEAELANDVQQYTKLPKIHRLNAASTMRDKGAWYKDQWRKKIERIGNLNYPDEARRQQIHGSLRLRVSIRHDGSLHEVQILESSGQQVLDQAALRIVRLAAPFAPLTGDLEDFDLLEITRTWRFERGDRLSSN